MTIRIDIVTKDEAGKEIARRTAGEYGTELEAIMALHAIETKIRKSGEKHESVEMVQIMEGPDGKTPGLLTKTWYIQSRGSRFQRLPFSFCFESPIMVQKINS